MLLMRREISLLGLPWRTVARESTPVALGAIACVITVHRRSAPWSPVAAAAAAAVTVLVLVVLLRSSGSGLTEDDAVAVARGCPGSRCAPSASVLRLLTAGDRAEHSEGTGACRPPPRDVRSEGAPRQAGEREDQERALASAGRCAYHVTLPTGMTTASTAKTHLSAVPGVSARAVRRSPSAARPTTACVEGYPRCSRRRRLPPAAARTSGAAPWRAPTARRPSPHPPHTTTHERGPAAPGRRGCRPAPREALDGSGPPGRDGRGSAARRGRRCRPAGRAHRPGAVPTAQR